MSKRRVVVTGLGAVTPIGNNVKDFWAGIRQGKVGIGSITKFDTTDYKVKIAAEVKDFNAKEHMDPRSARRMDPFCQYAVVAAKEALEDAEIIVADPLYQPICPKHCMFYELPHIAFSGRIYLKRLPVLGQLI